MKYIWLNGEFILKEDAKISVFDQGFLYGDGIFESFRSIGDYIYNFSEHFERLKISAKSLKYEISQRQEDLEKLLIELKNKNEIENAYFRMTISRGRGSVGFSRNFDQNLTCLIVAREFQPLEEENYKNGIRIEIAETRRNAPEAINPKIKSISNLNSLLGKLEAKEKNVLEVLMLNNKEHICEGSASNIFWVKDKWVFTPDVSTGLLEGVTRKNIIRICEENLNLRVITGEFKIQDIQFADEVFITSTTLEAMPVVNIGGFKINDGKPGKITKTVRENLEKDMKNAQI
jgi:branched-chain amino acid aminotransferase